MPTELFISQFIENILGSTHAAWINIKCWFLSETFHIVTGDAQSVILGHRSCGCLLSYTLYHSSFYHLYHIHSSSDHTSAALWVDDGDLLVLLSSSVDTLLYQDDGALCTWAPVGWGNPANWEGVIWWISMNTWLGKELGLCSSSSGRLMDHETFLSRNIYIYIYHTIP